ncbi:inter-alpha-trypsin inhibitor heavy chain H4-like isoform X2 [Coccinella septempunctata]|uniref:inter-alpha-trypsin inhibitor heavy chain H4-like isoform X2 n=1 Tax=Coccinella septempunctata TaxID=41139 RepID=UPI001D06F6BC|nr:inter-alpha-trypsin inhibitor heavy chain H4-like isoform X2 [Coccinella septempunctata]
MGTKLNFILVFIQAAVFISDVLTAPTTESFVLVSTEKPKNANATENAVPPRIPKIPKIYSMKVDTNVTNRFAKTLVTSKLKNLDETSQEATFAVVLPESAYISGFVMEIDGKKYEAYIKEKEEAREIYNKAVSSGMAAGHVEANARDSNRFTVSVNIEPQSKAIFYLTYEELLRRQNGAYDIIINLHPGHPVKDLEVQVNINESRPLSFVKAPSMRSGNEIAKNDDKRDPKATIERFEQKAAKITFKPDLEHQKELGQHLGNKEGSGLSGQFVVQYDVERDPQGGEVLVSDGYFVHFFAPSDLKPMEKHVVFVLDTSGSMSGIRIQQLKQAIKTILGQLGQKDLFNIIDFNSVVNVWNVPKVEIQYVEGDVYNYYYDDASTTPKTKIKQSLPEAFQVDPDNVEQAKKVIEKLDANGGTDIKSSLVVALQLLNETKPQRGESKQPIVIFLTDGEATVGEYGDQAINSITSANVDEVPIFSLSFGDGADRDFLEKLSLKNQGFARHIYEGADASLQLEEFYKYVSSPLLTKVNFKYVSKAVSKLTKTEFPIMFDGSEIVIAGQIDPEFSKAPVEPTASSTTEKPIKIDDDGLTNPNYTGNPEDFVTETPFIIDEGGLIGPEIYGRGADGEIDLKPKYENSVGSLEKHWAYLTLKQLLDERDAAENKTQYTKKALELALKYSFVTPVSSLVVVKPNNTKSEAVPEDASKSQENFQSLAFAAPAYPGAVQFMSVIPLSLEADYDHLDSAQALSTPFVDRIYSTKSTTQEGAGLIVGGFSNNTTSNETTPLAALESKLPWLRDILGENETLNLPNGTFKLGSSANVDGGLECTPLNATATGVCTLIKDCPQLYDVLTDVHIYTNYFCPIKEFAGVCCPKKQT